MSMTETPARDRVGPWSRAAQRLAVLCLWAALCFAPWRHTPASSPVEIYAGLTYSREKMPEAAESGGYLHLIRADLNVPGVEFFATPLDADAVARGWQYRLEYVSSAVRRYDLAAAVNGTMFHAETAWLHRAGDLARSIETVVSDHVVSHVDPNSYLLWWDDALNAGYETSRPTRPEVLVKAKWGLGSQLSLLVDGQVAPWDDPSAARRTIVGVDPTRRLVWLAVLDKATYRFANQVLAQRGAKFAVIMDGGSSSSMVVGRAAPNLTDGVVVGNWRPVAVVFGIRVRPLDQR